MARRALILMAAAALAAVTAAAPPVSAAIGWRVSARADCASAAADKTLAFASGRIVTMLGPDGKKLWSWQAPADVSFLERGPEASVYAAYSDTLTKLDAKGKCLWSATAYERIYSLLVLADGKACRQRIARSHSTRAGRYGRAIRKKRSTRYDCAT